MIPRLLFIAVLIANQPVLGQDRERFAPKELPNSSEPQVAPSAGDLPSVDEDDTELLPELKGIVFRTRPEDVSTQEIPLFGLHLADDEVMKMKGFQELVKPALGKPVSLKSLKKISRDVILFYRKNDVPIVDVVLPEQDVTNGVIQFLVAEGKLAEVKVEGNKYFKDKIIKRPIRLGTGDRIRSGSLLEDIDWINQNPFLDVKPVFAQGEGDYTTDLLLRVDEQFPLSTYLGYEDSGNDLIGNNRFQLGANWGNAFGLGHLLNYQLTMAEDFRQLNSHSISYVIPFDWRHKLSVSLNYTDSSAETSDFTLTGSSFDLGVRYAIPLGGDGNFNHETYLGFDYRRSSNALEFGVLPASDDTTAVGQFVLGYSRSISDQWGRTTLDFSGVYSPGGLFGNSERSVYDEVRPGANPRYFYGRLNASRLTKLPKNLLLSHRLTAQISSARLLNSEQLSVGGFASVRGYDEREFNFVDSGFVLRNELLFPSVSLLNLERLKDNWQFLAFLDYANVQSHGGEVGRADGSSSNTAQMLSVGPGLRLGLGDDFSLRMDYGLQLIDAGSRRSTGRFHLGATCRF